VVGRGESGAERPAPPRVDDTQLLAAVRAGDPTAANALYERSRPIADRTIRKLLGRFDQEHQDIFQQVMVEIVRTIDRYRGECSFDAWIGTLTAHVVYNSLRHRQVERRILSDAPMADVVAADQPARRALLRSTIDRVREHLAAIDPGRAWAFLLHDVHGYDLREMARIMNVSVSAAQSRLVRGRKELHERIAADPELAGDLTRREGSA
jgi:RNA polymerase sigma-70 factor (ECF subfamily)